MLCLCASGLDSFGCMITMLQLQSFAHLGYEAIAELEVAVQEVQ